MRYAFSSAVFEFHLIIHCSRNVTVNLLVIFCAYLQISSSLWVFLYICSIHSKTHLYNTEKTDVLVTFEKLINIEFNEDISLKAAQMFANDINKCINYINNNQNDEKNGGAIAGNCCKERV